MNKKKEDKKLTKDQAEKKILSLKKDLFNIRFKKINNQINNPSQYNQIKKNIARLYNNYDETDFMVLNLNRNQPRKRWDITIVAWANFIVKYYNNNDFKRGIKLIIATNHETYWDLFDILENEIKFTNVPWEFAKKTLVTIDNPFYGIKAGTHVDLHVIAINGQGVQMLPFTRDDAVNLSALPQKVKAFLNDPKRIDMKNGKHKSLNLSNINR